MARRLRRNAPLAIFGNPKSRANMSSRVYAIEYKHADDGKDYRHDFARGVRMRTRGSRVEIGKPGSTVWEDFPSRRYLVNAPDSERLRKAAYTADDAFSAGLRKKFGKRAGDARYQSDADWPEWLKALKRAKLDADAAWRRSLGSNPKKTTARRRRARRGESSRRTNSEVATVARKRSRKRSRSRRRRSTARKLTRRVRRRRFTSNAPRRRRRRYGASAPRRARRRSSGRRRRYSRNPKIFDLIVQGVTDAGLVTVGKIGVNAATRYIPIPAIPGVPAVVSDGVKRVGLATAVAWAATMLPVSRDTQRMLTAGAFQGFVEGVIRAFPIPGVSTFLGEFDPMCGSYPKLASYPRPGLSSYPGRRAIAAPANGMSAYPDASVGLEDLSQMF